MKNKYINILNPQNLLIKAYEFKLAGYINTFDGEMYFNYPQYVKTPENTCGLIRVQKQNEDVIPNYDLGLRSCDVLDSIDDILSEDNHYTNLLDFEKIEKIPFDKVYMYNSKLPITEKESIDDHIYCAEKTFGMYNTTGINNIITATKHMQKCINISPDQYFIYNKKINKTTKVILIGDIHGGYHSFYRLLLRFIKYKYITHSEITKNEKKYTQLKVNDGFVIILCGDVLDRGGFSFETLMLICNLMVYSNKPDDIRFIYNRGNHEHDNIFGRRDEGAMDEFLCKIKDANETHIKKILNDFYDYCPIATVLNYCTQRIFVCHGGIPLKPMVNSKKCETDTYAEIDINGEFVIVDKNIAYQIMWNDFSMNDACLWSIRDSFKNKICKIGTNVLNDFMEYHQIDMIIRGHQDSYANTVLFTTNNQIDKLSDFVSVSVQITAKNDTIKSVLKNNEFPVINKDNSVHGPIATFDLNKFKKQNNYKKVITISTNTGYGRNLTYDSFLLIEHDK